MNRKVKLPFHVSVFLVVIVQAAALSQTQEPEFADPIQNVTVVAGRDATLVCTVDDLSTFKVAWIHLARQTILTVQNHVITRNTKVSISHNNNHRTWALHLKNTKETDAGRYMCQINTEPVKTQVGYLTVVVPPDIIDAETSSEVIAREGSNVTLTCKAKGNPIPTIRWRREDDRKFAVGKGKHAVEVFGETLDIAKVSRLHMGAYLCIASNDIPPSVSKRIMLKVDFPPMLWIPHQLVGTQRHFDTTLDCFTEAYPRSINYWMKEDGEMIFANEKYDLNNTEDVYTRHMQLKIKNMSKKDFGQFKCVAKNPLGDTEGTIRVYETFSPTSIPTTTIHAIYERIEDHTKNKNDSGTNYKNPSSLIVQDHDNEIRYKSTGGINSKQDENLAIKTPKDWSHSESAHSSSSTGGTVEVRGGSCWMKRVLLLLAVAFLGKLQLHDSSPSILSLS